MGVLCAVAPPVVIPLALMPLALALPGVGVAPCGALVPGVPFDAPLAAGLAVAAGVDGALAGADGFEAADAFTHMRLRATAIPVKLVFENILGMTLSLSFKLQPSTRSLLLCH